MDEWCNDFWLYSMTWSWTRFDELNKMLIFMMSLWTWFDFIGIGSLELAFGAWNLVVDCGRCSIWSHLKGLKWSSEASNHFAPEKSFDLFKNSKMKTIKPDSFEPNSSYRQNRGKLFGIEPSWPVQNRKANQTVLNQIKLVNLRNFSLEIFNINLSESKLPVLQHFQPLKLSKALKKLLKSSTNKSEVSFQFLTHPSFTVIPFHHFRN